MEQNSCEDDQPPTDQTSRDRDEIQPPTSQLWITRILTTIISTIIDVVTKQAHDFLHRLPDYLNFLLYIFIETVLLVISTIHSILVECIELLFRQRWETTTEAVRAGGTLIWNIFQGCLQSMKNFSLYPEETLAVASESESE